MTVESRTFWFGGKNGKVRNQRIIVIRCPGRRACSPPIADLGSQNSRLLHRRSAALDRGCVERDCAQIPDQVFSHSLDPKLPLSYEGGAALITAETSRDRVQMKRLCDRCGSVIVEERGIGQIR